MMNKEQKKNYISEITSQFENSEGRYGNTLPRFKYVSTR